jgi:hypothetical protein
MKRRTLDYVFSGGGMLLAVLLLVLGLVLQNQANFAKTYVHSQLAEQQIVFTPVAGLTAQEKQAPCIVGYAGQPLTSGKQAECYANHYIGLHVTLINGGKTYSQTSTQARAAQAAATAAAAKDPTSANAIALQTAATATSAKATSLFQGETLRGLLLTSYGFSIFGERAQQAAWVAYLAALVLLLASLAGFAHAFSTSKNRFVMVEHDDRGSNGSGPKPTDEDPSRDGPVLAGAR